MRDDHHQKDRKKYTPGVFYYVGAGLKLGTDFPYVDCEYIEGLPEQYLERLPRPRSDLIQPFVRARPADDGAAGDVAHGEVRGLARHVVEALQQTAHADLAMEGGLVRQLGCQLQGQLLRRRVDVCRSRRQGGGMLGDS